MAIRSLCAWALLGVLALGATPASATFEVPEQEVVFNWTPASGPVAGYYVYVSVNSGPMRLDHATPTNQSLPIHGMPGDRLLVRVAAFDAQANVGPYSQFSEVVVLVEQPPPPPPPPPPGEEPPPAGGEHPAAALRREFDGDEPFDAQHSQIKVELESVVGGADGAVTFKLTDKKADLSVKAKGLEPDTDYELRSDGVPQTLVTTNSKGKLKLKLSSNAGKDGVLWLDPRGKHLALYDDAGEVLGAMISGPEEPRKSKVKEQALIESTDAGQGELQSKFQAKSSGTRTLMLRVKGASPGSFRVLVDGVEVGQLDTNSKGKGKLIFGKKGLPFDFDPRGALLELEQDGQVHFAGEVEAQLPGFSVCTEDELGFALGSTGQVPGEAEADIDVDEECNLHLRVALGGVPNGSYDLVLGGELVGTIQAPGGSGAIELETAPSGEALPLPFDPRNEAIEVEQNGVLLFQD